MLKEEFIKLAGFWPSNEIYQEVNADYEASNLDKKEFVANLLQKNFVRDASKEMALKITEFEDDIMKVKGNLATKLQTIKNLTEKISQKDDYIETLEDTVEVYRDILSEMNEKLIKLMIESKKK